MPRLPSLFMLAVMLGGGYMFLKGLHLEDIERVFASASQQAGNFSLPNFGELPNVIPTSGSTTNQNYAPPAANGPTFRMASFNIQVFGDSKASKDYIMFELAKIINQFDIVAVQEIRTQDDAFMARFAQRCSELGQRQWNFRVGPRLGNTSQTEQYAYMWDAAKFDIHPQVCYTIADPDNLLHREPLVAMFRTRVAQAEQAFTFVLVNVHTDPDVARKEMDVLAQVDRLVRSVQIGGKAEDDVIMLGDFNTDVPMQYPAPAGGNRPITAAQLAGLGSIQDIYPLIQAEGTMATRTRLNDNILINLRATTECTLRSGVYDIERYNGRSPDEVKQISDHLPIWAEFSVYESNIPGRMAAQPVGGAR